MPTKRPSPPPPPPPKQVPSAEEEEEEDEDEDEEEEEEEEEDDEEDDEEEETDPSPVPKPGPKNEPLDRNQESEEDEANATKATLKTASLESDSESGSESESESGFQVKPITSKPMDSISPQKPVVSKPKPKPAAKRSAETVKDEKGSKKKAKVGEEDEDDEPDKKKQLFQRIWSEDDEFVVLKGVAEFTKKHGAEPQTSDMAVLLGMIKGRLHVDVSNRQLNEKIRRLKKKYQNNAEKIKKGGALKPQEHKIYEVSKKLWGREVVDGEDKEFAVKPFVPKANLVVSKKSKQVNAAPVASPAKALVFEENVVDTEKEDLVADPNKNKDLGNGFLYEMFKERVDLNKSINVPILSDNLLKKGLSLLENSKVKELEEKWESLQIMELEVYLKGVNLVRDQTKMILDALKKSSS